MNVMEKSAHPKSSAVHEWLLNLIELIEEARHLKSLDRIKNLLRADMEGRVVILNAPQLPVEAGKDACDTDVYCPHCKKNLSGIAGDEWIEARMVLQCPRCGTYLDSQRLDLPEDPLEDQKLRFAKEIGDCFGSFWQEGGCYCVEFAGKVSAYDTLDALLLDWYEKLWDANVASAANDDWEEALDFIYTHIYSKKEN